MMKPPDPSSIHKILVLRNDHLGDFLLTVPLIKALEEFYPEAKISILTDPLLMELKPILPFQCAELIADQGFLSSLRTIRSESFDLLLCPASTSSNSFLSFLSQIPHRIGFAFKATRIFFHHLVRVSRSRPPRHEAEFCLDFLRCIGLHPELEKLPWKLNIPSEEKEKTRKKMPPSNQPYILIHPGSSGSSPNWPCASYRELAARLAEHHQVLITGSAKEKELCEEVAAGHPSILSTAGWWSLSELAALCSISGLMISGSTGPMHLAAAADCPTLSFFSSRSFLSPEKWKPLGDKAQCLISKKNEIQNLSNIPFEQALEAVAEILQ